MTKHLSPNEEPPSRSDASKASKRDILVGRDREGHWVVKDRAGLHGGLFVDRAQALKYAMREIADRMHAVIMVPGILELDWGSPRPVMARSAPARARLSRIA